MSTNMKHIQTKSVHSIRGGAHSRGVRNDGLPSSLNRGAPKYESRIEDFQKLSPSFRSYATMMVGQEASVKTTCGLVYEGIFMSVNHDGSIILAEALLQSEGAEASDVLEFLFFSDKDIEALSFFNINTADAMARLGTVGSSQFTDSGIAHSSASYAGGNVNGSPRAPLVPFFAGDDSDENSTLEEPENNEGTWDFAEMVEANKRLGCTTSYKLDNSQYTNVPVPEATNQEGKRRLEYAERMAREIQSSPSYVTRQQMENIPDEETAYSAVVRESQSKKYVPPPLRRPQHTDGGKATTGQQAYSSVQPEKPAARPRDEPKFQDGQEDDHVSSEKSRFQKEGGSMRSACKTKHPDSGKPQASSIHNKQALDVNNKVRQSSAQTFPASEDSAAPASVSSVTNKPPSRQGSIESGAAQPPLEHAGKSSSLDTSLKVKARGKDLLEWQKKFQLKTKDEQEDGKIPTKQSPAAAEVRAEKHAGAPNPENSSTTEAPCGAIESVARQASSDGTVLESQPSVGALQSEQTPISSSAQPTTASDNQSSLQSDADMGQHTAEPASSLASQSTLNPKAAEFKLNPDAAEFKPRVAAPTQTPVATPAATPGPVPMQGSQMPLPPAPTPPRPGSTASQGGAPVMILQQPMPGSAQPTAFPSYVLQPMIPGQAKKAVVSAQGGPRTQQHPYQMLGQPVIAASGAGPANYVFYNNTPNRLVTPATGNYASVTPFIAAEHGQGSLTGGGIQTPGTLMPGQTMVPLVQPTQMQYYVSPQHLQAAGGQSSSAHTGAPQQPALYPQHQLPSTQTALPGQQQQSGLVTFVGTTQGGASGSASMQQPGNGGPAAAIQPGYIPNSQQLPHTTVLPQQVSGAGQQAQFVMMSSANASHHSQQPPAQPQHQSATGPHPQPHIQGPMPGHAQGPAQGQVPAHGHSQPQGHQMPPQNQGHAHTHPHPVQNAQTALGKGPAVAMQPLHPQQPLSGGNQLSSGVHGQTAMPPVPLHSQGPPAVGGSHQQHPSMYPYLQGNYHSQGFSASK